MLRSIRAALVGALLLPAFPAYATFHVNSISEVMSGFGGDPNIQYVEIRMDAGMQNLITNTFLTAFNADGTVANVLLQTPSGVPAGTLNRRILYATSAFQTATGLAPDFVIPAGIFTPSGMVCWGAPNAIFVPAPGWDTTNPNNYIDCVAYGSYTGPTRNAPPAVGSSGTPSSLPPGDGTTALTRISGASVSGSNAIDFELLAPGPCKNAAGGCGDVGCALPAGNCAVLGGNGCPNGNADPGEACDDGNLVDADGCRINCKLALMPAQLNCRLAIDKAATSFAKAVSGARSACENALLQGKIMGPCPDSKTGEKISAAEDKLEAAIQKKCAVSTTSVGYGATCPGFDNQCQTPITGFSDVSTCISCVHERFVEQLESAMYGQFASGSDALKKCQLTIAKTLNKYYQARYKLDAKCEQEVASVKRVDAGICADGYLSDVKFGLKFTGLLNKARAAICKACGGADKTCDGVDDFTPAAIGYSGCPTVTNAFPGANCQDIFVGDLSNLNSCLLCIAVGSEPDCAQVVATRPDQVPAKCNPTPTATPAPTPTSTP